ncbi:MAG: hypothetical protein CMJ53_09425 [Planctomycetaceae bacterium]|nr:hypothetical protein [Planctomycetaceae bacterium]
MLPENSLRRMWNVPKCFQDRANFLVTDLGDRCTTQKTGDQERLGFITCATLEHLQKRIIAIEICISGRKIKGETDGGWALDRDRSLTDEADRFMDPNPTMATTSSRKTKEAVIRPTLEGGFTHAYGRGHVTRGNSSVGIK